MNTPRPPRSAVSPWTSARLPPVTRREQSRLEPLTTVDSLQRRRADLVCEGFIEDYVALRRLEWNGGALGLTLTETSMCEQMRARSS